jgi:hypothetical protein
VNPFFTYPLQSNDKLSLHTCLKTDQLRVMRTRANGTATELPINTSATALDMADEIFGSGIVVNSATYSGGARPSIKRREALPLLAAMAA